MSLYSDEQVITQLDKRKGGYSFIQVPGEVVNGFSAKRATRLVCTLDDRTTIQCGLNHLGDGNFFIILGAKIIKSIGKKPGDRIRFVLNEDPDPLGVPMPEVLLALLEQDEALNDTFTRFTAGKKRFVIHAVTRIKDIDKQVSTAIKMIRDGASIKRSAH